MDSFHNKNKKLEKFCMIPELRHKIDEEVAYLTPLLHLGSMNAAFDVNANFRKLIQKHNINFSSINLA